MKREALVELDTTMQPLSWWLHCLVLRTLPGPLQRREEQRLSRSSGSSDNDDGEEVAPLRPGRPSPLPTCGSFKACRNGAFCSVAALAMAVLIILVMHLCLDFWQDPTHVSRLPNFFVHCCSFADMLETHSQARAICSDKFRIVSSTS